jgi:hypothetical protein
MAAVGIDTVRAVDRGHCGPVPGRTAGPAAADRSVAGARPGQAIRSWPLLVLAAPAAAEVWSGWVGIAQKTGFGLVSPLPGIWPSLHLDTAITLPVGVEAYAAYALRAWLARDQAISGRTRRFAKWSAIFSFALGMAGQVAYHLMAQAGMARAPWPVTTVVACLPVLVLGMGTALAHMLRADAEDMPDSRTGPPTTPRSLSESEEDWAAPGHRLHDAGRDRSDRQDQDVPTPGPQLRDGIRRPDLGPEQRQTDQACVVGRRLAMSGKPVSRRALRSAGVRGSNEALNALARMINAERSGPSEARETTHDGTGSAAAHESGGPRSQNFS